MGNSSSASLPYTIEEEEAFSGSYAQKTGWSIHRGKRKSDSEEVTVFRASKPNLKKATLVGGMGGETLLQPAAQHFRSIKKYRHPSILRVFASLDTDNPNGSTSAEGSGKEETGDLIIVTEKVMPLEDYLRELAPTSTDSLTDNTPEVISWGVMNMVQALHFLHATAAVCHGSVCPASIWVTPAGDFKLGNFCVVTPIGPDAGPSSHFMTYENLVTPKEYRSPERVERRWDAISNSAVHCMDSYSVAMLLEFIYSHPTVGTGSKLPQLLVKATQKLKMEQLRQRPRLGALLKCPLFENEVVKAHTFLDELATKPSEERVVFWQQLPDLISGRQVLGRGVALHKVFPSLVTTLKNISSSEGSMSQDVNRREALAIIPPLFQIAEMYILSPSNDDDKLADDDFKKHFTPIVELLFAVNDRGVRGAVLQRVPLMVKRLDKSTLNLNIFEPMCSGFSDSSAPLRELTLKTTIVLVPFLTPANLEKLTRYLIRLQSDPESSIRTNTVIFIGKVAPSLSEVSRSKLVLPAFTRAMKDTFVPCRLAALKAVLACKEYFDAKSVAEKVLPCVVPHLMDPTASDVRNEAFRVVDAFMVVLRVENERLTAEEKEKAALEGTGGSSATGSSLTSLASSFTSASFTATSSKSPTAASSSSSGTEKASTSSSYLSGFSSWTGMSLTSSSKPSDASAPAPAPAARGLQIEQEEEPQNEFQFSSLSLADANIGAGNSSKVTSGGGGGWDDDDDDDLLGDDDDDGFGDGNGDINDDPFSSIGKKTTTTASTTTWATSDTDDDLFGSTTKAPPRKTGTLSMGGLKTPGGKLMTPSSTTGSGKLSMAQRKAEFAKRKAEREATSKANVVKLAPAKKNDVIDDGWDDF